ncbi:MAG: acetate/propionate family kinase [Pirellulaceae bacterium]|nr:acetate/propionate family kinase [Pirellulaceae bacterium]
MKVLVANLGSTSFKYRLFDMTTESQLARGGVERIGAASSLAFVQIGDYRGELELSVPHHGIAVKACIDQLSDPEFGCIQSPSEISAIGFKAVHGGRLQGVFRIDANVLDAMEEVNSVAPAHNPPYIAAMRQLAATSHIPLVAAFETDFHRTIPESQQIYAIPSEWTEALPIRRWGFHGASHRYIGWRAGQLLGRSDARIVSCHLGGSNSLCAIRSGRSVATTMGMSPQSGLPQNNRIGDLDPFCLPMMMAYTGKSLEEVLKILATQGGLLGVSGGLSGDIRDLEAASESGNAKAKLALDIFVTEIRRHLGGMMMAMGGADAIVFTGGIGENSRFVRAGVCQGLEDMGIALDLDLNQKTGAIEARLDRNDSKIQLWVVPTNEELIVARQTVEAIESTDT